MAGASVALPPSAPVAAAAAPVVLVSTSASVVMAVAASVLVIAVPAVLLMTAGTRFFGVALTPAGAVLLGRGVLVGGVIVLPGARSDRFSTCQLPVLRGEAAVQLLELLRLELPHHAHLETEGEEIQQDPFRCSSATTKDLTAAFFCRLSGDEWDL